jgi:hypothetical protein
MEVRLCVQLFALSILLLARQRVEASPMSRGREAPLAVDRLAGGAAVRGPHRRHPATGSRSAAPRPRPRRHTRLRHPLVNSAVSQPYQTFVLRSRSNNSYVGLVIKRARATLNPCVYLTGWR